MGVIGAGSILVSDEPEHMRQRRILLPPFHGERVGAYRELIGDVTRAELAGWPVGRDLRLWPRMQAITLEVIVRAVFGITEPERRRRMHVLLRDMLNRLTSARWVLGRTALTVARARRAVPRDPGRGACSLPSTRRSTRRSGCVATARPATTSSRCCSRRATRTARN